MMPNLQILLQMADVLKTVGNAVKSAFPWNGVISGASSVLSSLLGNKFASDSWKRQQEFNDPARQVERLRNAGLNPAMVLGNGGSSVAGNAVAPAPTSAPDFSNLSNMVYQDRLFNAQLKLLNSQSRKNNADAGYTESDQIGLEDRNHQILARLTAQASRETRSDEIEELNYNTLLVRPTEELEMLHVQKDIQIIERGIKQFHLDNIDEEWTADMGIKLATAQKLLAEVGATKAQMQLFIDQHTEWKKLFDEKSKIGFFAKYVQYQLNKALKDGSPSNFNEVIGMSSSLDDSDKALIFGAEEVGASVIDCFKMLLNYQQTKKGLYRGKVSTKVETLSSDGRTKTTRLTESPTIK